MTLLGHLCTMIFRHIVLLCSYVKEQASRVMQRLEEDPSDIAQYNFLSSLLDRNETLYYKLLIENIKKLGGKWNLQYADLCSSYRLYSNCRKSLYELWIPL